MDYSNWYILYTESGKEEYIRALIKNILRDQEINLKIFYKEITHLKKDKKNVVNMKLFPSYIFIQESIGKVMDELKGSLETTFLRPVAFNNKIRPVDKSEIKVLLDSADKDDVIKLSYGHLNEKGEIKIIRGPLMNYKGRIVFINKKKGKAKVALKLFNREIFCSLGIDLIK